MNRPSSPGPLRHGVARRLAAPGLLALTLFSAPLAGEDAWPRYGGPSGDFRSSQRIAREWPKSGPREIWRRPLGAGYSAVVGDRETVYTLYLDGDQDVVVALSASDGTVRWTHRYANQPREENLVQFGRGPNATPLLLDDLLVTLGYNGELKALDRATGELLWQHDLIGDFGGKVLRWGYSASPILHDGKVIVLVGGEQQAVVALDPADGEVLWQSPPSSISYASPIVLEVDGRAQLLYYSHDGLNALDPSDGSSLWKVPITNGYENHASMPIYGRDGLLWAATQQEGAARVLRPGWKEGQATIEQLWANPKVRIHFWNAVRKGDTVYAVIGDRVKGLAAIDVATGEILWRRRDDPIASLVLTPSGTLRLDEEGELALLDLDREGVTEVARAKVFDSLSWSAPTLIGERLFLRNKEEIVALDLAPAPAGSKPAQEQTEPSAQQ